MCCLQTEAPKHCPHQGQGHTQAVVLSDLFKSLVVPCKASLLTLLSANAQQYKDTCGAWLPVNSISKPKAH